MNEEPDNLILQHLRGLRGDVATLTKEVRDGFTAVEARLGRLELAVSDLHGDYAALSIRMDGLQADIRLLKSRYETVG